jgi:hypothetical protein
MNMLITVHRTNLLTASSITLVLIGLLQPALAPGAWAGDASAELKSIRKTCGKCPDGYATTGVTEAPELCKGGDPTMTQCVPLGVNMLPVCGSCPDGYREVGHSSVPARCGSQDGGRLAQCQLETMEQHLPDPAQGGKICPPDCGRTPPPGRGTLPPPPKYVPAPDTPQ